MTSRARGAALLLARQAMTSQLLLFAATLLVAVLAEPANEKPTMFEMYRQRHQPYNSAVSASLIDHRRGMRRDDMVSRWNTLKFQQQPTSVLGVATWGSDWSSKLKSLSPLSKLFPRHHVSTASNSPYTVPSPANVYSDIYKRSRDGLPTIYPNSFSSFPTQTRFYSDIYNKRPSTEGFSRIFNVHRPPKFRFSDVPMHYSNPFFDADLRDEVRRKQYQQANRFDGGTTSSASNSDNLSHFAYNLNSVVSKQKQRQQTSDEHHNIDDKFPLTETSDVNLAPAQSQGQETSDGSYGTDGTFPLHETSHSNLAPAQSEGQETSDGSYDTDGTFPLPETSNSNLAPAQSQGQETSDGSYDRDGTFALTETRETDLAADVLISNAVVVQNNVGKITEPDRENQYEIDFVPEIIAISNQENENKFWKYLESPVNLVDNIISLESDKMESILDETIMDSSPRSSSENRDSVVFDKVRTLQEEHLSNNHILLDHLIDLKKLIRNSVSNFVDERHVSDGSLDDTEGGKSFTDAKSSSDEDKENYLGTLTNDNQEPLNEKDFTAIYLELLNTNSRQKGTKLKGSLMADFEYDTNGDSFSSFTRKSPNQKRKADFEHNIDIGIEETFNPDIQNINEEVDIIGNQIAAINRRGDIDPTNFPEVEEQNNGETHSNDDSVVHNDTLNNDKNYTTGDSNESNGPSNEVDEQQNKVSSEFINLPQTVNQLTEARWRTAAKNQNKQMMQGVQAPTKHKTGTLGQLQIQSAQYKSNLVPNKVNLGQYNPNLGPSNVNLNQYKPIVGAVAATSNKYETKEPYQQPHPGWEGVKPYQYSSLDPLTGAYNLRYGDAYQWRHEQRRADGVTHGGYGWLDADGKHHVTHFIADAAGYRILQPGQQINVNVLPVYPSIPDQAVANPEGSSNSYKVVQPFDKNSFITPKPLPSSNTITNNNRPYHDNNNNIKHPYLQSLFGSSGISSNSGIPNNSAYHPITIPGSSLVSQGPGSLGFSFTSINNQQKPVPSNQSSSQPVNLSYPQLSNVGSSFIPASILNDLLQQVSQQYQTNSTPGGRPIIDRNHYFGSGHPFPFNIFNTQDSTNRNYEMIPPNVPHSMVSVQKFPLQNVGMSVPFLYRGPAIDNKPSNINVLLNQNEMSKDKVNAQQAIKPVVTGRPPISYPLPVNHQYGQKIVNVSTPLVANNISAPVVEGIAPLNSSTASDIKPWSSSVIRVKKPPRSPSLDYAFLTDDEHYDESNQNQVRPLQDIGRFVFDLLMNPNQNTNNKDKQDLTKNNVPNKIPNLTGNENVASNANKDENLNSGNKTSLIIGDATSQLGTTKNKGTGGKDKPVTVGDYLGTVKWKIPVLGALEGLQQHGPVQVTKGYPPKSSNVQKTEAINDIKNHQDKLIEGDRQDHKEREKVKIGNKTRRRPPPPPINFFTEVLKHLMTSGRNMDHSIALPHQTQ